MINVDENEYLRLVRDHPTVSFNADSWEKKEEGSLDLPVGRKVLVAMEPYNGMPHNWEVDYIKNFETYVCWNSKFLNSIATHPDIIKSGTELVYFRGNVFCNHYNELEGWPEYDNRIKGICALNKLYDTGYRDCGDIIMERLPMMKAVDSSTTLRADIYANTPWGKKLYQGTDGSPIHHSHVKQLELISCYLFALSFECIYHPIWSYDFVTERIFNAFKCKTVPVYWGGWNIEQFIPANIFIDMRKFADFYDVSKYMENMSKAQWEDMTQKGYIWGLKSDTGSMKHFENLLERYE